MSHTPGPWTAAADKTLEGLNVYTITGPGVCGWVADVNRAAWQKSSEANAKLIAAAPDLLEALRELLAVSPYDSTLPEVRPAVDKSIAALRKAIG